MLFMPVSKLLLNHPLQACLYHKQIRSDLNQSFIFINVSFSFYIFFVEIMEQ